MAWQQYVDSLKSYYPDMSAGCGIFGTNGSTWAQEGLDHAQANYTEITDVYAVFSNSDAAYVLDLILGNTVIYKFL